MDDVSAGAACNIGVTCAICITWGDRIYNRRRQYAGRLRGQRQRIRERRSDGRMDWKRKLTSRKLWMAIASFVSMMYVFYTADEETATQVSALIMAGATVIGYIVGEGLTDSASVKGGK